MLSCVDLPIAVGYLIPGKMVLEIMPPLLGAGSALGRVCRLHESLLESSLRVDTDTATVLPGLLFPLQFQPLLERDRLGFQARRNGKSVPSSLLRIAVRVESGTDPSRPAPGSMFEVELEPGLPADEAEICPVDARPAECDACQRGIVVQLAHFDPNPTRPAA